MSTTLALFFVANFSREESFSHLHGRYISGSQHLKLERSFNGGRQWKPKQTSLILTFSPKSLHTHWSQCFQSEAFLIECLQEIYLWFICCSVGGGIRRNIFPYQPSGGNYLAFNWPPAINLTPYPTVSNQCPKPFLSWQDCHTSSFGCHSCISHVSYYHSFYFPSSNGSASSIFSLWICKFWYFYGHCSEFGKRKMSLIWYVLLDLLILFHEVVQVPGLVSLVHPSPDSHFAFLHLFSMGMVLIPVSCTMSGTSFHSSSGTVSIRSRPLNLFLTSTV